jgi:hypothetical protein
MALHPAERRLFVRAWLALPAIDCSLRLIGFQRTRQLLARLEPLSRAPAAAPTEVAATADRMARVISIAGRHCILDGTCLRQALLLWHLLRRSGLAPEILIGVSSRDGFRAHAWVGLSGRNLSQAPDIEDRFAAMACS